MLNVTIRVVKPAGPSLTASSRHNKYNTRVPLVTMELLFLLSTLLCVDAATKVAVLEFGKKGIVRRTNSQNAETTVEGVASFWNALHRNRRLQHSGMTVVPDMFIRADSGLVIYLSGADLEKMPAVSAFFSGNSVGHMEMQGSHYADLMKHVDTVDAVNDVTTLKDITESQATAEGLTGVSAVVNPSNVLEVDRTMDSIVDSLEQLASSTGKNIVLHVVVEEEDASVDQRRLVARRLEDEPAGEGEENQQQDQQNQQNAEDDNGQAKQYSGYYGYGYYNDFGEWVTPYKTMFQIQYFNVVLWTSIGLTIALFFVIYLMLYMPLEPDTLLFGESAKIVGVD